MWISHDVYAHALLHFLMNTRLRHSFCVADGENNWTFTSWKVGDCYSTLILVGNNNYLKKSSFSIVCSCHRWFEWFLELNKISCLQRGDRKTESTWKVYEAPRTRKNRTSKEGFRYVIKIIYSYNSYSFCMSKSSFAT